MTNKLTRRTALAGAAALPLAGVAGANVAPALHFTNTTDPAVAAYRVWRAAATEFHALLYALKDDEDPRVEAADAADHVAAMKLAETVPTTLEGLACLIAFVPYAYGELSRDGDVTDPENYRFGNWNVDDRETALARSLRAGVQRLLQGGA